MADEIIARKKGGFLKTVLVLLFIGALACGGWHLYNTGELLNALNWLLSRDPILLVILAVVGLIGIAMIMGG